MVKKNKLIFIGIYSFICVLLLPSLSFAFEINPKVAVVYSNTTYNVRHSESDFEGSLYLYDFTSTQHQLIMAGIPFEMIGEKNLTNLSIISQYNVLVLPSFSYVPSSVREQIITNLETSVKNGLNVYALGDLMIGDEVGSLFSYPSGQTPLNRILNVDYVRGPVDAEVTWTAMNSSNPVTWRYNNSEQLFAPDWYGYTEYQVYNSSEPYSYPFQVYSRWEYDYFPVTVATKNGKGNTFYADNPRLTDQSAIGRDAVLWLLFEDKPHFGIKITNSSAIFSVRVDADDSGETNTNIEAIPNFIDLMTKNNLLGGWYITAYHEGSDPVDWDALRPYYQLLMNNSFEIGSHSITHILDINQEPDNVVWEEFYGSKQIIDTELGINITGYANAGMTPRQLRLWKIADEASYKYYGGLQEERYKGLGYVSDQYDIVNIQSNMISDYELMDLQRLKNNQVSQYWINEFNLYYRWGDGILIFGLWHDYLLMDNKYSAYFGFAKYVNQTDTESLTPGEIVQRFINWTKQDFLVESFNGGWSITRLSPDTKYGQITPGPNQIKYFTGTSNLKLTPDNKSYVFNFESDTVTFYLNKTEINISLNKGWNLVSFPLKLSNNSVNHLFNDKNMMILGYNDSWFVPKEIDSKKGYWIRSNESANINLTGYLIKDDIPSLDNGWNLIGNPYLKEINVSLFYVNVTILSYNGTWQSCLPGRINNSLKTIKPGYGYFIKS